MEKKQITIRDLAHRLNIHHSTVSRALRNHPDVNPATKQKVLDLAKQLDYHPNSIAQALTKSKSKTIGVVVPTITNDFFAKVISGIESVAYDAGYYIMLCQSNENYEHELLNIDALLTNRVCGALVCISQTTKDYKHLEKFQHHQTPIVFYDRECMGIEASNVVVNDFNGAFNAVEYLIKAGYKRIAHISGPKYISNSNNRKKGYIAALKKYSLPVQDELIIAGGFTEEYGLNGFKELQKLDQLPDAIFAVNDTVAIGAFKQIKQQGIKIPDDIALIGFSNNPMTNLVEPSITTVSQPAYEIGETAVKLLIEEIESIQYTPKHIELETKLIIRKSTK